MRHHPAMGRRLIGTVLLGTIATGLAGSAAAASHTKDMQMLAPEARVEQRCNARAMGLISREQAQLRPDELVAYAFADTTVRGHSIQAPGAAVRSRGKWYHLAYSCTTSDDDSDVLSFQYSLGAMVPGDQWSAHYLVP